MPTGLLNRVLAMALLCWSAAPAWAAELADLHVDKLQVSGRAPADAAGVFLAGANYPWLNYGGDFGANAWGHNGVSAPASRAKVAADFAYLSGKGVKTVRWFVFCDGRAGLTYDKDNLVTGLDRYVYPNLDAALEIAKANGIRLILVLFDFHLYDPGNTVNGAYVGGRASLVNDVKVTESLFKNALEPILGKYGHDPAVLAWEVMNEPEMAKGADMDAVRAFARKVSAAVHGRTSQMVTLGSCRRGLVAQWKGVGLDFYQFHYYDYMALRHLEFLDKPYSSLGLDKPCLLGEFPTKNTPRGVETFLQTAKSGGYMGALAWSLRATDSYTDFRSVADRFSAWAGSH